MHKVYKHFSKIDNVKYHSKKGKTPFSRALSSTVYKHFFKTTIKKFKKILVNGLPIQKCEALDLGNYLHSLVLDKKSLKTDYFISKSDREDPKFKRSTKKNPKKIVISKDEVFRCKKYVRQGFKYKAIRFLNSKQYQNELAFTVTLFGVLTKVKMDKVVIDPEKKTAHIYDLKSIAGFVNLDSEDYKENLRNSCVAWGYYDSAVFYMLSLKKFLYLKTGIRYKVSFFWVFLSKIDLSEISDRVVVVRSLKFSKKLNQKHTKKLRSAFRQIKKLKKEKQGLLFE